MIKKLIISDIDGTILDKKGELPKQITECIKDLRKKGVEFTLASGRMLGGIPYFINEFEMSVPVILANGALVYDIKNKTYVCAELISSYVAGKVAETIKSHNAFFYFYSFSGVFCETISGTLSYYENMNKRGLSNMQINKISDITEATQINDVIKFVVHSEDDKLIKNIRKSITEFEDTISITSSNSKNIEITTKGTSKGNAIKTVASYTGVKSQDIMCIGDELNDLEMLRHAGFAVAMGNANEELKKIADYVTDTNENLGFVKAAYRFLEM